MSKVFKIAAVVVLLPLVLVIGLAASKPNTFRYERMTEVQAPAETVFALVNDFHRWKDWSPYEKLDPAMKRTINGSPSGRGAVYAWESQGDAGVGRMEITESTNPSKIAIKLDFSKPFTAHNTAEFTFEPQGERTKVTWAMQGPNPFLAKTLSLFLDMDGLVGKDFESGLANLKSIAETSAVEASSPSVQ